MSNLDQPIHDFPYGVIPCLCMAQFGSLNEIVVCLVCIINVVKFEFQIQIVFFYSNKVI
jgi:hypothetical protein